MSEIFDSYDSRDRDRIKPLVEALKAERWSVWWDRDLIAGASFDEKIISLLSPEIGSLNDTVVAGSN